MRWPLRHLQINAVLRAKQTKREITKLVRCTDRVSEDAPHFFLHRHPMLRGKNPQARQSFIIKISKP